MVNKIKHIDSALIPEIRTLLGRINDPEIPVLSITDLGILRDVLIDYSGENPQLVVKITPTYSGCPAMNVISMQIRMSLLEHGYDNVRIETVLSPAWTSDWMSAEGKDKLKSYGIAAPNPTQTVCHMDLFRMDEAVQCPLCISYNTSLVSQFGSTACKAHYVCRDCAEPFDYFKSH